MTDRYTDPWPPDHHVHPVEPPHPAGHDATILRSGLELLAGSHHHPPSFPGDCPGCIAQRILNGETVDQPRAKRATEDVPGYDMPLMIRLTDPPEVINPQVLGGRGVLMLPPEVSIVPFMADTDDTDQSPATDDPWANPAVGETMLGIRAGLRDLTRRVNRFMAGLPGEG